MNLRQSFFILTKNLQPNGPDRSSGEVRLAEKEVQGAIVLVERK